MTIQIETQRLLLRRWNDGDLSAYSSICADPEVMRWIGDGSLRTCEECAKAISNFEKQWDNNGFGLFAVERKDTRRLIGFTGLAIPTFLPEVLPAVEIGWRLGKSAWGKGFATEAAKASLSFGFGEAKIDKILSIHQIGNDASGRIMQKLGMQLARETVDPTCNRPVRVFELTSRILKR